MSEFSLKVFHVELPNARSKEISIATHHHPVGVSFQSCHFGASRDFTASKKQASTASQSSQTMGPHADKTKTATATYSFTFHPWDLWQCCLFCLLPPVCQIFGRKEPMQWSPEFWMHQVAVPKDSMVNVRSCTRGSKDLRKEMFSQYIYKCHETDYYNKVSLTYFFGICSKIYFTISKTYHRKTTTN